MKTTTLLEAITRTGLALALGSAAVLQGASRQSLDVREAAERAVAHVTSSRAKLGLPEESSFRARNVLTDDLGQEHVRVDQFYRGVPVFEGDLIVHLDGGTGEVLSTTVDARPVRGVASVSPVLSSADAVAVAHGELRPLGAYSREPEADLVVTEVADGRWALAWHVHAEIENAFETRHADFLVDARNGNVLDSWDSLETAGVTGTGNSQYSGTVALSANGLATGYELRDMSRGTGGNVTYNLNHATSGTGTIYTDSDDVWGDGANYVEGSSTTAANGQTAAVDAHYGLAMTWDYYKNVHGRNGIDNKGSATYSRVHYSNSYDNAFWSDTCFCMTYGDGSTFTTLTSIDVAGHEMSHGVCSRTANLTYRGESGGLNEANSDIFGTMVEFYARPVSANYLIGEQLYGNGKALRYMYKPSLDGRSPDCYSSSVGRLDVHYSSGIGNRFFYFLTEGTTSLSGASCNASSFAGVGRAAAERIWYRALTVYMTSKTTYSGAKTATLKAATDLYGAGSTQYAAVAAAWAGVAVP